jgi:hypothetical protein
MSSQKIGTKMQNFATNFTIRNLIFTKLMQVSLYLSGERKGGYIEKIQEVGSNGIVGILWVEEFQEKTKDKLKDGQPLKDMLAKL